MAFFSYGYMSLGWLIFVAFFNNIYISLSWLIFVVFLNNNYMSLGGLIFVAFFTNDYMSFGCLIFVAFFSNAYTSSGWLIFVVFVNNDMFLGWFCWRKKLLYLSTGSWEMFILIYDFSDLIGSKSCHYFINHWVQPVCWDLEVNRDELNIMVLCLSVLIGTEEKSSECFMMSGGA